MKVSREDLQRSLGRKWRAVYSTFHGQHGLACAVLDTGACADAPLVYVSEGFTRLTGYGRPNI